MKSLVINKQDLKHNIKTIKKMAEDTGRNDEHKNLKIIAVVKGNGYGLGLVQYSKFLIDNGITFLAVSTTDEAIKLRKSGINVKILMLSSTAIEKEIQELIENEIILTVGSREAGQAVDKIAQKLNKKAEVHLKIDSGFGRYGFCYNNQEEILKNIKTWNNINITGTFSHFSMAFYEKNDYTKAQFNRFMDVIEFLKENKINTGILHICNSSAFLKFKEMRLNAVRIGSAFLGRIAIPNIYGLKKIAVLKANVSEIKTLPKGYNIGYSNSYTTKKETTIGIIPVGYADGYNVNVEKDMFRKRDKLRYIVRDIKDSIKDQNLYVSVNGEKCRVLGRIGMFHISVDITGKNIKINDEAILNVRPMYVDSSIRREYINEQ